MNTTVSNGHPNIIMPRHIRSQAEREELQREDSHRQIALGHAVAIIPSSYGPEKVVEAAQSFLDFLNGKSEEAPKPHVQD